MNKSLISASIVVFISVMPTFADDLAPPTWRGGAGTTFQHWDFSAGPGGGAPDGLPPWNNANGIPNLTASGGPTNWLSSFAGRNDVWQVNANNILTFDIPNFGVQTHQKDLVLQVTYFDLAPTIGIGQLVMGPNGFFTQVGSSVITSLGGGWVHEVSVWNASKCPPFEHVQITPPVPGTTSFVDQVVIDTRCYPVPTPGALALAGIGGLISRRRRIS
ncbi:MAG: hypothetical protein K8R92_04950 [Planctomycetes bacterium]|nr:hypothetical protein [Planctomycetota bacterium]